LKRFLKRIGRAIAWPARRFFDPRFNGVIGAVEAGTERTEFLGRSVEIVSRQVEDVQRMVERTYAEAEKASGMFFDRLQHGTLSDLDARTAAVFEREVGFHGLAAQAGLWFNPPVTIGYEEGGVIVRGVNERVAEIPYVFRGLGGVRPGSAVLDVGAAESTVALSLAALGYHVTALDPRPYGLTHPRLRSVVSTLEDWDADLTFAAVICLSTVEHIGLAAYGVPEAADGADRAAMRRMLELTDPGGVLLLTTRFGRADADSFQRTYDRPALQALLDGWTVEDVTFVRRENDLTWEPAEESEEPNAELVVLVTARRPG
jgi:Methyltransferase domain